MKRTIIHVDHLNLRLRGISPETARASVAELGRHLQEQLCRQPRAPQPRGMRRIETIDAGAIVADSAAHAGAIGRAIAGRVAGRIVA